jgi:hypothetical protein
LEHIDYEKDKNDAKIAWVQFEYAGSLKVTSKYSKTRFVIASEAKHHD